MAYKAQLPTDISLGKTKPKVYTIDDFSGGVQTKTSIFLNKKNELQSAVNTISSKLGGISKRPGYIQKGDDLTSTTSTSTSTSTTSTSTSTTTTTSTSSSTSTTTTSTSSSSSTSTSTTSTA